MLGIRTKCGFVPCHIISAMQTINVQCSHGDCLLWYGIPCHRSIGCSDLYRDDYVNAPTG